MIADEERIEHCDAIHIVKEERWVVPGYGEGIVNIVKPCVVMLQG